MIYEYFQELSFIYVSYWGEFVKFPIYRFNIDVISKIKCVPFGHKIKIGNVRQKLGQIGLFSSEESGV